VVDQGLISGSNFVLSIVLARCLHPVHYGAYALAFSMLSLLSMMDQAVVLEPMSVFGGSKYRSGLRRYVGHLLRLQTAAAGACVGLLLIGALGVYAARYSSELGLALCGAGFATFSVLLLAFTRRALYLEYRSKTAAGGAILYCALLFAALLLLYRTGWLSPFTAFLGISAAALAASILLLVCIRPTLRRSGVGPELAVANEHWCYGRWALGSAVLTWISWNVWYTIAGGVSGLAATGTLKALLNLAMPVIQSCAALSLLVLPRTAQVAHAEGWPGAKRQAAVVGSLFTAGATLYWIVVLMCRGPLITFLYSGRYGDIGNCLPWLAVASIATSTVVGPVSALRALERPSTVCLTFFISSFAALAVGIPATRAYGVGGAIAGIVICSLLALGIAIFMLARVGRQHRHIRAPEIS
jgi:O-antigen/teichoic acid export membrane protein